MGRAESAIEVASRHVMDGDMRCCRQADLIERIRQKGQDTTQAEDLLNLFEEFLALSYAHLHRLTEELCRADRTCCMVRKTGVEQLPAPTFTPVGRSPAPVSGDDP